MATSGSAEGVGKSHTRVLRDTLRHLSETGCSDIPDPTGNGDPIRCAPTAAQREQVHQQVSRAADRADRAVEAEERGDNFEARRLWGLVFNDDV
jgi:hypothetical protein